MKKVKIVIAEDDKDEREFIQRGFAKSGLFEILELVRDGYELVECLLKRIPAEIPDLILSDVNMPLKNGYEALAEIKNCAGLKHIPYLMFSTSNSKNSMNTCMELGAEGYLCKPPSFLEYEQFARDLYEKLLELRN
jgi:CheY-like chemotaxis protein